MTKKEIQHKLEQAQKDKNGILDNITELKRQFNDILLKELEAEKPKLRHGEIVVSPKGCYYVAMEQNLPTDCLDIWAAEPRIGESFINGVVKKTDPYYKSIGINIFDLLEEWGEDLEEREVAGIRISVRSDCIFVGEYRLSTQEKQELFWKTIAQEYFTLKRKEKLCS